MMVASPRRLASILADRRRAARSPFAPPASRRRHLAFALVTVALTLIACLVVLLAADIYLHRKYERTASVNVWGYRGPTVGPKQPLETRIAVFGGSTAFGYGPDWDGSFPYLMEQRLNALTSRPGRFVVVNLAYNNDGAFAFRPTMEDYEYLEFEIAILYEGYNDLGDETNRAIYRRDSPIFQLTGYLPILPLIAREKAMAILYAGDINRGYGGAQTVFQPSLSARAASGTLNAFAGTVESLERQLGRLTPDPRPSQHPAPDESCGDRWMDYCGSIAGAIDWVRLRGLSVIVCTQPYISDRHVAQQRALTAALATRVAADPAVVHVNLGDAINLRDERLAYDGMHLTGAGNAVIADALVEPVLKLTKERQH